jgi:hypothetical protein
MVADLFEAWAWGCGLPEAPSVLHRRFHPQKKSRALAPGFAASVELERSVKKKELRLMQWIQKNLTVRNRTSVLDDKRE